jgi:hypothetical protein
MSTHDDGLEPTPQDYGFPKKPLPYQVEVWNRQELFLAAYARVGRRSIAAKEAGLSLSCIEKWIGADVYGIRKRMECAHQEYVENLEQLMDDRLTNPQGNRGSDVLLMFKLKAEAPEKYREEAKVIGVDASKQMMDRLREMATKERKRAALEAPAIEGEFKEVGESRAEAPAVVSPSPGVPASQPPAVGKGKPGRYQQRRERSKGRFTRR